MNTNELDALLNDDDDDLIGDDSPWVPTNGENLTGMEFPTKYVWVIYERLPNHPVVEEVGFFINWYSITHWAPLELKTIDAPRNTK